MARGRSAPIAVMIPGYGGAGRHHWQTEWQRRHPRWTRAVQRDWDHPRRDDWVEMLDRAIAETAMLYAAPIVLVAHGLGCSLVAHWAQRHRLSVAGAFLVSPPDITQPDGTGGTRFHPLPLSIIATPSLVVASDASVERHHAEMFARATGSMLTTIARRNRRATLDGAGPWQSGEQLLLRFMRQCVSMATAEGPMAAAGCSMAAAGCSTATARYSGAAARCAAGRADESIG